MWYPKTHYGKKRHDNIKRVTSKTITFKEEYKIDFVRNCIKVVDMDEYLASLGLSLELIGKKHMEESFYRWNAIYNEEGPAGLVGVDL